MITLDFLKFLSSRTIQVPAALYTDEVLAAMANPYLDEFVLTEVGAYSIFWIGGTTPEPSMIRYCGDTLHVVKNRHCDSEAFQRRETLTEHELCQAMIREIIAVALTPRVAALDYPVVCETPQ